MKAEKVLEVVVAGVVTGLTVGAGFILAQRLMGKFGSKEVVVVNEKSEVIGMSKIDKGTCRDNYGRPYPCGTAK